MANVTLRDVAVSSKAGIDPRLQARLNLAKDGELIGITIKPELTAEMVTDQAFVDDCTNALQDATITAEDRSVLINARAERHAKLFKSLSEAIATAQMDLTKDLRGFKPLWSYSVVRSEKTRAIRKSDGLLQMPCYDVDITARQVKDVQTRASDILAKMKASKPVNGKPESANKQ